ncbi:hypothetical protein T01_7308 [Trichinella spiralis]|uniref:Uncharacterized protein n=1 Tax=Trichinella spiralis TaxID=6334 RepID=A0A0V1BQP8_TRISP|nr:hypothetical protein T01_7308 [Trichinella spiralis]
MGFRDDSVCTTETFMPLSFAWFSRYTLKSMKLPNQLVPFNQPLTRANSRRERCSPEYNVLHLCVIPQAMLR